MVGGLVNDLLQPGVHTTDTCSDYWCMARWVEINTGNPVYRIRDDRVVDINTGNPVYRIRDDRVVDINTGDPIYCMSE